MYFGLIVHEKGVTFARNSRQLVELRRNYVEESLYELTLARDTSFLHAFLRTATALAANLQSQLCK